ncbi:MAG TPA: hypothetical protein VH518_14095 [Tepidisphaeraceae bacterium]|jgi:hypothetical protein
MLERGLWHCYYGVGVMHMTRTTIMLPAKLKARAQVAAKRERVSLGHFVRDAIERRLLAARADDPLFAEVSLSSDDWPADVAQNHEKYLQGLLEERHLHGSGAGRRSRRKAS